MHLLKPATSKKTVELLSIFVYVWASICNIPYVIVRRYDDTLGYKKWPRQSSLNIIYTVFLRSVQCLIPVMLLSIIYFKIYRKLVTQNRKHVFKQNRCQGSREPTSFQSLKLVICFIAYACPLQIMWVVVCGNSIISKGYTAMD